MSNRLQLLNHLIAKDLPPDKLEKIRADFPALAEQADIANGVKKEVKEPPISTRKKKRRVHSK